MGSAYLDALWLDERPFSHQNNVDYVLPENEKAVWAGHSLGKEKSKK